MDEVMLVFNDSSKLAVHADATLPIISMQCDVNKDCVKPFLMSAVRRHKSR